MALTRELLKGMALNEEQIEAIITEHVNAKKSIEAQRDALQKQLDDIAKGKDWKAEHDKLKQSFDDYKAEIAGKEALQAKQTAFRQLLSAENIPEKYHDRIIRLEDFSGLELDGDTLKDAQAVRKAIKENWGDYVATPETRGVNVDTPPTTTSPGKMTIEQIDAIADDDQRQQAIAANHELFGF